MITHYRVPTPLPGLNSLPFPDILTTIPFQFCIKFCVKSSHVNIASFKIPYFLYWMNSVLFVTPLPAWTSLTFPWLIDPFLNPSWLCQPIPYLFTGFPRSVPFHWSDTICIVDTFNRYSVCIKETGNLLNSRALWQSRACAKEWKHAVYMSTQTFSTQFTAKDIDFLHFSSVSCQKHIEMNIEWIRMDIPVLISMHVDRYNDKPCTGAEA